MAAAVVVAMLRINSTLLKHTFGRCGSNFRAGWVPPNSLSTPIRQFSASSGRFAVGDGTRIRRNLAIGTDACRVTKSSKQVMRLIFNAVRVKTGSSHFDLKYSTKRVAAASIVSGLNWQSKLIMNWPRELVVEATGVKKVDAERNAASIALKELKESGVLDENNSPLLDKDVVNPTVDRTQMSVQFGGHPKAIMQNVYQVVRNTLSTTHVLKYVTKMEDHRLPVFETTLQLTWPSSVVITARGRKKTDAESHAALKALQYLKEAGVLDGNNRPLCHSEQDLNTFRSEHVTIPRIDLQEDILVQMENVVREISNLNLPEDWVGARQADDLSCEFTGLLKDDEDDDFNESKRQMFDSRTIETAKGPVLDIFSGYPYHCPREWEVAFRNQELKNRGRNMQGNPLKRLDELPIASQRSGILTVLRKHPVVVLVGETGCGKTTQVPQFILEEMVDALEGAECNVVVTQPRRIGAVSIARRVAEERCERLGDVVGYRVRLDGCVPQKPGRILFCSTGDLMRRLLANPNLVGVSHVIVDEVHERDVLVDFLLILLRDLVRSGRNPGLRILVMSATLDHERLVPYFDDCPTINVQGFTHPVRELYREDLSPEVLKVRNSDTEPFAFDADAVVDVVRHIDVTRPPGGAILVFLPGWQEIQIVHDQLRRTSLSDAASHWILPVHSRLSTEEQSRIFERPTRPDIRKIVLATNIAETSITVDDVSYVVDCGLHREMRFSASRGVASLETRPVSLANARQRRGRAGRTRPGECFHLYSRASLDDMDPFPTPEMQRAPLETVVLDAKAYMPDCTAAEFLAKAVDPPSIEAIRRAVKDLQDMDMLDDNETLTPLGRLAQHFTGHPKLAKAVIISTMFGCENAILTVAAVLSNYRSIFLTSSGHRNDIQDTRKQLKRQFIRPGDHSDHFTAVNAFESWLDVLTGRGAQAARAFCVENGLNADALLFAKGIKEQLKRQLSQSLLCEGAVISCDNSDSKSRLMAKVVLAASFTPHLLHLKRGSIMKSRIVRDAVNYVKMSGYPVALSGDSVNHMEPPFGVPWLVYFSSMHSVQRRRDLIRESSAIPLAALFLVAGKDLFIVNQTNVESLVNNAEYVEVPDVTLALDGNRVFRCLCSPRTARALINVRQSTRLMLRSLIMSRAARQASRTRTASQFDTSQISAVHGRLVAVIARLIANQN